MSEDRKDTDSVKAQVVDEPHGDQSISAYDDARIRKRIDVHLLPLICVVVALQFVRHDTLPS